MNNHNTEKIRKLFEKGKRLTVLSALNLVGTIELRKYVSILRREGLNISDEWKEQNGKRFKVYYIQR